MDPIKNTITAIVVAASAYFIYPMYKEHVSQHQDPPLDCGVPCLEERL